MADDIGTSDDLAEPVQTILTADKRRIKSLTVDAESRTLIVRFSKGTVDGNGDFTEVFADSKTVENTDAVLDDDGQETTPADPAFNKLMQNKQLATAIRNAAQPWPVARILRTLVRGVL